MDESTSTGERIRYWRDQREMSREALAGQVGRSASWLEKVEYGERPADKVSLLKVIANVLKVEFDDLVPGIRLRPNGGKPLDPPKGIHAVRREVEAVQPAAQEPPPDMARLRHDVERARQLDNNGSYEALALVLPGLLVAGRAAAAADAPGAWSCLAGAYQAASTLAKTVGELDLAWIAADRGITAARRSGDIFLIGVSQDRLANACMRQGRFDDAAVVVSNAADVIAPTGSTPPQGWSVWGKLHLTGATAAIRLKDKATAQRLLRAARNAAGHVGAQRNDYGEAFGLGTVSIMEVAVALEAGDPLAALRTADRVRYKELPTAERRARFCLYVAHAQSLRKNVSATVDWLLEAANQSEGVLRHQILARDLMLPLIRQEQLSATPRLSDLRDLAARLGVKA